MSYRQHGAVTMPKLFDEEDLRGFERTFFRRLLCQAYKMGIVDSVSEDYCAARLDELVLALDAQRSAALDFVVQELREAFSAAKLLTNKRLQAAFSNVLECPIDLLKVHIDGILVNLPGDSSRLYTYHSEQHYCPFRRNFSMLWMPVVREKTAQTGAMLLKLAAHRRSYSLHEYGEADGKGVDAPGAGHQLGLIEEEIREFETFTCDLDRNEALIFHQNAPHASQTNTSSTPSYALIIRCFDYRRDLTLSDRSRVKPYTSDAARGGYPGIRPIPL